MDIDQKDIGPLLLRYRDELEAELENILAYWSTKAVDHEKGGFYGRIGSNGIIDHSAVKGSVLYARILWTFSAACIHKNDYALLPLAHRAYDYITGHFMDRKNGGLFWSIHSNGRPADTKKQVYAIAFAIYALSGYYRLTQKEEVRNLAIGLFTLIEEHACDPVNGGYTEALTADWQPIDDLRLSAKDANEKKTMNTHLHVLEAYTALYAVWPDEKLKEQLHALIRHFTDHMIHAQTHHLNLFFSEQWQQRSDLVSFGHDIEASWLLAEAALLTGDPSLIKKIDAQSLAIAQAAGEGLDTDGGLFYEYFPAEKKLVKEKHWWPQAEAMVGFFHAWEISGNRKWLHQSILSWEFVKEKILDKKNGEWFWGIDENGLVMEKEDKAGFWKCPYHNSRACMEIIRRINSLKPQ